MLLPSMVGTRISAVDEVFSLYCSVTATAPVGDVYYWLRLRLSV